MGDKECTNETLLPQNFAFIEVLFQLLSDKSIIKNKSYFEFIVFSSFKEIHEHVLFPPSFTKESWSSLTLETLRLYFKTIAVIYDIKNLNEKMSDLISCLTHYKGSIGSHLQIIENRLVFGYETNNGTPCNFYVEFKNMMKFKITKEYFEIYQKFQRERPTFIENDDKNIYFFYVLLNLCVQNKFVV